MARLFGTDGVRGVANHSLSPEMTLGLGQAVGIYFKELSDQHRKLKAKPRIIIGKDTRVSGDMLEAALMAGITSVGVDVILAGVIPTPGVAFLCRHLGVEAGAMISASHNPVEDNGIKFFNSQGFKLADEIEDRIEAVYEKRGELERPIGVDVGRITTRHDLIRVYEDHLVSTVSAGFEGLRIVLDCGFGAGYELAPRVLERLGADIVALHNRNVGSRINVKCGSTHPVILQKEVLAYGADIGIALDGDADRLIVVDECGEIVDGDQIITVCGLDLLSRGRLKNNKVAVTVYSNLGLIQTFKKHQADVIVTANGDRYVLEALLEHDLILGGEQSGHIIFLEKNTTGDGILSALQLLQVLQRSGQSMSELAGQMERFPQVLENVQVARKEGWEQNHRIREAIQEAETGLRGSGRIFVRASGTEPLIRVMAEGPDEDELKRLTGRISGAIREELG